MESSAWIPFLLLCLTVELTPGPNMAYLAILSISAGRRAGFAAIAGIALGLATIGTLAAIGVAEIISASLLLTRILIVSGIGYLLWLAWDTWHDERETSPGHVHAGTGQAAYFGRGVITNLLNPKAFLFYATLLPGFVGARADAVSFALLLTGISVLVATSIHISIVLLASKARPFLGNVQRQQRVRKVMAVLLVAVAGWFLVENAPLMVQGN